MLTAIIWTSCSKENYAYTCTCTNNETGTVDSVITIRTRTSGEAGYSCRVIEYTVDTSGRDFSCTID